jgi:hypothetical protein
MRTAYDDRTDPEAARRVAAPLNPTNNGKGAIRKQSR